MLDFCRRAILGEIGYYHWSTLADILVQASQSCRDQTAMDMDDVKDSGGR